MRRNNHIADFVTDLLNQETDLRLEPMILSERQETYKLAADSVQKMRLSASKIGSMSDTEQRMLVRVFKDTKKHCYRLYLMPTRAEKSAFCILKAPDNPHSFIANENGEVEIPVDLGIHPLESSLDLTFPRHIIHLPNSPPDDEPFDIDHFQLTWERDTSMLTILNTDRNNTNFRHLVLQVRWNGKSILQLVPMQNFLARIPLGTSLKGHKGITFCVYP